MYEIFEQLLKKYGVTAYKVSKATGISTSTLSDWKNGKSIPKSDKMQILADYFNVTLEFLTTGRCFISKTNKSELSLQEENDISKDIDNIIEKLDSSKEQPVNFGGKKMSEDTINLLKDEFQLIRRKLEIINKKSNTVKKI